MDREEQILNWYLNIQQPTDDDRADLQVMLMDKQHPSDASSAVMGIITNLLQHGFRESLYSMLLMAASKQNAPVVKSRALGAAIFVGTLYDDALRASAAAQEDLLDLLVEQSEAALFALCRISTMRKNMIIMGNVKNLRQTLIYRLVVVGDEANQRFDQSC